MSPYRRLEWTPEKIQKFWDFQSHTNQSYFSYQVSGALLKLVGPSIRDCRTVLDYGSGPGFLIAALLEKGYEAAGVDFSEKSIERVTERFKGAKGFLGAFSLAALVQSQKKFDAIFVLEVIEHLDDKALGELVANLKSSRSCDAGRSPQSPYDRA